MISGVRSDLAVKLFGDDLDVLKAKAAEIERVLKTIAGNADVSAEQITGQPVLQIKVKQETLARYGLPARAVLDLVESVGSKPLGEVVEGQFRFPLVVRLPERWRQQPEGIGSILIATPAGERIPLSAAGQRRSGPRAVHDHPRMGPAAHRRHVQRPRPRPGQLRGRGPAARSSARCNCRRAATTSSGADSSRTYSAPGTRLLIVVPLGVRPDLRACCT